MCFQTSAHTHLIFLTAQLILQVELLSLQLIHPLPQLLGLFPVRRRQKSLSFIIISNSSLCVIKTLPWLNPHILILELILAAVLDVQRFASVTQDLLLLLSLSLPLAAPFLRLRESEIIEGSRLHSSHFYHFNFLETPHYIPHLLTNFCM